MSETTDILLAIHHHIFRDGVELIIADEDGLRVSDSVKNSEELFERIKTGAHNLLILDLSLPDVEVPGIIEQITDIAPDLKILALSDNKHPEKIKPVLKAGAAGYIFKKRGKKELINAIGVIQGGNQYLCDDSIKILTGLLEDTSSEQESSAELTERELEVLNLICREYTNKQIGDLLSISVRTVDAHRRNILQKTGAKNTAGLVKYAIKHNVYNIEGTG